MKTDIVAVCGIAGVGKSTALQHASTRLELQVLSASQMIAAGRNLDLDRRDTGEILRSADISANQDFLTRGFSACRKAGISRIALDCHTVIDAPEGFILVPTAVFAALEVSRFVLLVDSTDVILKRRCHDLSRTRPIRTAVQLEEYQQAVISHTKNIANELGAHLSTLTGGEHHRLGAVLALPTTA